MKKIIFILTIMLTFSSSICHAKTLLTTLNTVVYEEEYEVTRTEALENVRNSAKKEIEENKLSATGIIQSNSEHTPASSSLKTIMFNASNGIFRK